MSSIQVKFLLIILIPTVLFSCFDIQEMPKPLGYKKQFVFFPINGQMPDFFQESTFGKHYSTALNYFNFIQEKISSFECITGLPSEADLFIQKGIDDFERYYAFALNKNYAKKLKVVLTNPVLWVCSFLAIMYPIHAFFYKRSLFYYTIGLICLLGASSIIFFRNLCPCQLIYFWERKILQNSLQDTSCKQSLQNKSCLQENLWFLKHPLHKSCNREHVINAYKTELRAMFFALKQLEQPILTYTICPLPIFLNSFSSMNLNFKKPILIFTPCFDEKKIRPLELLFSETQRFKVMVCTYDYPKKLVSYAINGELIRPDSDTQTDKNYFENKVCPLIGKSLHAVVYIRPFSENKEESDFYEQFDSKAFQIAYTKKAHLIHFENSRNSLDACSARFVFNNHSLLDSFTNTALLSE